VAYMFSPRYQEYNAFETTKDRRTQLEYT